MINDIEEESGMDLKDLNPIKNLSEKIIKLRG